MSKKRFKGMPINRNIPLFLFMDNSAGFIALVQDYSDRKFCRKSHASSRIFCSFNHSNHQIHSHLNLDGLDGLLIERRFKKK